MVKKKNRLFSNWDTETSKYVVDVSSKKEKTFLGEEQLPAQFNDKNVNNYWPTSGGLSTTFRDDSGDLAKITNYGTDNLGLHTKSKEEDVWHGVTITASQLFAGLTQILVNEKDSAAPEETEQPVENQPFYTDEDLAACHGLILRKVRELVEELQALEIVGNVHAGILDLEVTVHYDQDDFRPLSVTNELGFLALELKDPSRIQMAN